MNTNETIATRIYKYRQPVWDSVYVILNLTYENGVTETRSRMFGNRKRDIKNILAWIDDLEASGFAVSVSWCAVESSTGVTFKQSPALSRNDLNELAYGR